MLTRSLTLLVAVILGLAGCGNGGGGFIECRDDTSCDLAGNGECIVNAATGHQFCAYPDDDCDSGMRWSELDVEESISGTCVVVEPIDAGVDTPVDASLDAAPGSWSTPLLLAFNNDEHQDVPHVSSNGTELYFVAPRYDKIGIDNVWWSVRSSPTEEWGNGAISVPNINSAGLPDRDPFISSTGLEIVFVRDGVLYRATRSSLATPWGTATSLAITGTDPVLISDDLTLYYVDPAASCPVDTCRSRRTRASLADPWGAPVVESFPEGGYRRAHVSADGLRVLLSDPGIPDTAARVAVAERASLGDSWSAPVLIPEFFGMNSIKTARWSWDETEIYLAIWNGAHLDIYVSRLVQ